MQSFLLRFSLLPLLLVAACGGAPGAGQPLHVASTDSIEISVGPGGPAPTCPAMAGRAIAFDYRVDFASATLHIDDTVACSTVHTKRDVPLRAADRDALLALANAMVFERVPSCGLDGATTTLTVYPPGGVQEQYAVDGQGGDCTVGVVAIRGAEFDAFYNKVASYDE